MSVKDLRARVYADSPELFAAADWDHRQALVCAKCGSHVSVDPPSALGCAEKECSQAGKVEAALWRVLPDQCASPGPRRAAAPTIEEAAFRLALDGEPLALAGELAKLLPGELRALARAVTLLEAAVEVALDRAEAKPLPKESPASLDLLEALRASLREHGK